MPAPKSHRVAFLAGGRLFLLHPGAEPEELTCSFAENVRQRMAQLRHSDAWKTAGAAPGAGALAVPAEGDAQPQDNFAITGLAPGPSADEILYGLNTEEVAGIFSRPLSGDDDERRLVHTSQVRIRSLSAPDEHGQVVCSFEAPDGIQNLSVYRLGSPGFTEITEGDSLDCAACWIPGLEGQLVYQSAGIGRDAHGRWAGTAPTVIEHLDVSRGAITTSLSSASHDFLAPQATADGALYCIRRPFSGSATAGLRAFIRNLVTAPFRFAAAAGGRRDPATTADSTPYSRPRILGAPVDVLAARDEARRRGESDAPVVPKSWQLVRTRREAPSAADAEVLARGVIAYCVASDGSIAFSNGNAIFHHAADEENPRLLCETEDAERIVFV